jgi:MFS family permease
MRHLKTERTIGIFALASFLNDMGSDMIYSIWPLFVTRVLGANMATLGFIDGLGDAVVSLSSALSGYISDRMRKRKIFILLGYLFGSLSRLGYAVATVWQHLIPIRILDRAGKIRSAPRDAIIADMSVRENRGGNFGLLRAMDNLGAVCGILLSIWLLGLLGYRKLFLLAAIPSALAVLLILFFIKEKGESSGKIFKGFRLSDLDRNFRLFLILSAVFALGSFSYSFLLIYAKDYGFKDATVPMLYLIFTAVAFLFSIPFGKLADRIGRKAVLQVAFIFWALVCLCFIFLHSTPAIVVTFILYGLHRGALDTVQKTFVAELSPVAIRASSLGGFQMVIGLCALPASFIAGLLWDKIGIMAPFALSLGLTILSMILLILVKESKTA